MSTTQPAADDQQPDHEAGDTEGLEARLAALERDVRTLTAAVDAASRLRISSLMIEPNVRIAGGNKVRRILEKGGLVRGYPERPKPD